MKLVKRAKEFIDEAKGALLLGLSGGPDSKALLYALLEAGVKELDVAHVDHGWREESERECAELKKEVEELGLRFFSIRLSIPMEKNSEAIARDARLAFFRSLFEKKPYRALLLAHHADDLAETVLKRILEGAHLPFLGAIREKTVIEEMPVWRPFLTVSKKEIWTFLDKRKLIPLIDRTNFDPKYLRTRLRGEVLPELSAAFGKEVTQNLVLLAERAHELRDYLDQKVEPLLPKGGDPIYLKGVDRVEARHLLQKMISFPRVLLEEVLDAIEKEKRNVRFETKQHSVKVDGGWVFISS